MMSECKSTRHSEYDCLIKWSVSGLRFTRDKWCEACQQKYQGDYE